MGRGRGGSSAAKDNGGAKLAEKPSRATRGNRKSYVEDEGSDDERYGKDDAPSSPEIPVVEDSEESEFAAESSGSEYGKKKKKGKSPKKTPAKRGRKPAGKAQLSPKKRGRKPKAATAASTNGKRKRQAESSDDEEEKSVTSPEESEDEVSASGDTSGSEYGKKKSPSKKLKKEKATRSQPRRQAATSPKKRGRKPKEAPATANGSKKLKLDEVEKSEDEMEIEEERKKSEGEDNNTTEDEVKESTDVAPSGKKPERTSDHDDEKSEEDKPSQSEEENGQSEDAAEDEKKDKPAEIKEKEKEKESGTLMNRTETDYAALDVSCHKKTSGGEEWNFKIACWNVAGIKSWVKKDGLKYLKIENPDIMCLQETKCSEKTKPNEVKSIPDYPHAHWTFSEESSGHNGLATFSKVKPESVNYAFPNEDSDSDEDKKYKNGFNKEGRLIVTEFEKFYLVNAYVPNSGRPVKDDKRPKPYPPKVTNGEREAWDRIFRSYVKSLEEKKPVIIAGDLNVAHEAIDLANPKTSANLAGFTEEERDGFTELLNSAKLIDSFRLLHPEDQAYSFWTYMSNCRQKNIGWRLDYFLISEKLRDSLCESIMRKDVYGSDHCPIVLFVHI